MKFSEDEIRDLIKQALADVDAGLPAENVLEAPEERFEQVQQALKELFTENYREFIEQVTLVAPKPATFKVDLPNGNNIFLKWLGEAFEIQVEGKRYKMDYHEQFMQALNHITELFKYGTPKQEGSFDEFGEEGEAGSPGSGGDFPGEPTGDFSDIPDEGGEDFGGEEPAGEEPDFA
jgi:hypothetical protein